MKKFKMIFRCTLLLIGLMTLSCHVENEVSTELVSDIQAEEFDHKRVQSDEFTLLIEWHEGVTEQRKSDVRNYYISNHILLYHHLCGVRGYETWFINCAVVDCKKTDTPVDTDDDVRRVGPQKTCKDI